ncbi:MAG: hypothetical protein WC863_04925 [Patescibacteria group bacterium]
MEEGLKKNIIEVVALTQEIMDLNGIFGPRMSSVVDHMENDDEVLTKICEIQEKSIALCEEYLKKVNEFNVRGDYHPFLSYLNAHLAERKRINKSLDKLLN